jgi:hypothetical protein
MGIRGIGSSKAETLEEAAVALTAVASARFSQAAPQAKSKPSKYLAANALYHEISAGLGRGEKIEPQLQRQRSSVTIATAFEQSPTKFSVGRFIHVPKTCPRQK